MSHEVAGQAITWMERHLVVRSLQHAESSEKALHTRLAGLYAGNPKRATSRPAAEALMEAFKNITLSVVTLNQQTYRHLTPLSGLQERILALLDFSTDIYARLTLVSAHPPYK